MRIAVNGRLLVNQAYSGVHRYVYHVLCELLRQIPEASFLVVTDRKGALPTLPRAVERVTAGVPARHPVLFYAWLEWSLPRAARQWEADVLVSLENLTSLRTSLPQLLVVHDLAYRHRPDGVGNVQLAYYRHFMPRFVRRADSLVAVSEATRSDIVDAYGVNPNEVVVAPNGVRGSFLRLSPKQRSAVRERFTEGRPYFVYVGAVHPRKNVDGLVRAFTRFKRETGLPHRLVIAGQFAWKAEPVRDAIAASAYEKHILQTGYASDEDIRDLIAAAEALTLLSYFEGFGVPIVEAFRCGVPVVVSDRGSLPEVAGPGGLVVDPDDEEAIASALARLATDGDLRQVLAKAGQRHAEQYSWQRTGSIIAREIERLVSTSET